MTKMTNKSKLFLQHPSKMLWVFMPLMSFLVGIVIPVSADNQELSKETELTGVHRDFEIPNEFEENLEPMNVGVAIKSMDLPLMLGNLMAKLENGGIGHIFSQNDVIADLTGKVTNFVGQLIETEHATESSFIGNMSKVIIEDLISGRNQGNIKSLIFKTVLDQMPETEDLQDIISDNLGMHRRFGKALAEIITAIKHVNSQGVRRKKGTKDGNSIMNYDHNNLNYSSDHGNTLDDEIELNDANRKFMELVKEIFSEEFGTLDFFQQYSGNKTYGHDTDLYKPVNVSASGMWMIIKSTWQRILSYVKRENSLKAFMDMPPVKIIDRILSLGDNVNLMGFLATKLDPDFALFVTDEINPYLGPVKDFESFYSFMSDFGLSGIIDYSTSERVAYTLNTLSRLMSAYLQDTVSDDLVSEYIEFISFNNTELSNLYKSFVTDKQNHSSNDEVNGYHRFKRQAIQDIGEAFKFFTDYAFGSRIGDVDTVGSRDIDTTASKSTNESYSEINPQEVLARSGYGNYGYETSKSGGYSGGYGGGYMGYGGGGSMVDPYIALGALALGTLLGFLLFRLINGTRRRGRRDINDGSLSLWLSDMPEKFFFGTAKTNELKTDHANTNDTSGEDFNLPVSLRGDIWSSDPLVGDEYFTTEFEEDEIADELNQLWRIYKNSSNPACVHTHLCHVLANSTAEDLTGRDSSMALLMASVSNLMGVVSSGQLVDDVTHTLAVGGPYTCSPSLPLCQYLL